MKVLLFANDLMPFGPLPTSGGGLRCYQLMKGLEAHGVEVVPSMPGFTFLAEKHREEIPGYLRDLFWRWGTQDDLVRRVKPDAVLFASNWDHFNLVDHHDVPVVIDLHGPRLIETTMFGNPVSRDHKVRVLAKADCLLCAGRRQRSYFYGWLLQAGRVPAHEHFIRYVPVSMSPELPEHVLPDPGSREAPRLVSGGGWYPWQNQSNVLLASCREVVQRDRGVIELYGTPHESPTQSEAQRVIHDIYRQVRALADRSPRVRVQGYVGREQLIEIYRHASVALEAMQYNLERELAFTTRTIEYLWCGLPVLYNDYAEVSEHIREYDAGWLVDPDDERQVGAALDEIFSDPAAIARKSVNAQRLVRDRFLWDKTVLPLLDFLQHPQRAATVEPVVGAIARRPSYFGPTSGSVQVPLTLPQSRLTQAFMIPADHTRSISIPFTAVDSADLGTTRVTIRVKTAAGWTCAKRSYRGQELAGTTHLTIAFPWYWPVRGGELMSLQLVLRGPAGQGPIANVGAMVRPTFPMRGGSGAASDQPLALSFTESIGRRDRIRISAERAVKLLREGQIRLFISRVRARVPHLASRLLRLVTQRL